MATIRHRTRRDRRVHEFETAAQTARRETGQAERLDRLAERLRNLERAMEVPKG